MAKDDRTQDPAGEPKDDLVIIMNTFDVEIVKGKANRSNTVIHSPANALFSKIADNRLTKVSELRGNGLGLVAKVRAARLKNRKQIYVFPTHDDDPNGIPVNRYGSGAWINLITILSPAKLTIVSGHRERFAVEYALESPVGPALVIDLNRSLERRISAASRKADSPNRTQTPPSNDKKTST